MISGPSIGAAVQLKRGTVTVPAGRVGILVSQVADGECLVDFGLGVLQTVGTDNLTENIYLTGPGAYDNLTALMAASRSQIAALTLTNQLLRDRIAELEAAMHEAGLAAPEEVADEDGRSFPAQALGRGRAGGAR